MNPSKKPFRILLADDDIETSLLLRRFIEAEGYETAYAPDGETALRLYAEFRPDLVLLDINMPGINGFEVARRIRLTDSRTFIFFLTDRTEKTDRLQGFSLRGNDYVPKPFYPEELMARIRERFESASGAPDKEYCIGDTIFRPAISAVTYAGETHALSVRQTEILTMLVERKGSIVDRDEILRAVWGDASYANSLALNVQISYLRRLLPDPRIAITSIKKRGYILTD